MRARGLVGPRRRGLRPIGLDIVGGSVYDALVGQASVTNHRTLLTRDRRAERTYRSLGVGYRFVD